MATLHKLKKNCEFKKVYGEGRYYVEKYLVMYIIKNNSDLNKVGFSVSKKVGKSVVRNKLRRYMKEVYRHVSSNVLKGFDMVFTARVGSREADFRAIEKNMLSVLKKAKLIKSGD